MRFAAVIEPSHPHYLLSLYSGPDQDPLPASSLEITQARHEDLTATGLTWPTGDPRYLWKPRAGRIGETDRFLAIYDLSTEVVMRTWSGNTAGGLPAADPGFGVLELTRAQNDGLGSLRHEGGGPPRWKVVAGVLEFQQDSRPLVRLTRLLPLPVQVGGDITLELGGPAGSLRFEALTQGGAVNTNVTNDFDIPVGDGRLVRVSVVAGVATKTIPTAKPRRLVIGTNPLFRSNQRIAIQVIDTEV